ncbi:MAG: 50S ribosomal protein L18 [Candidatus Competibacter denitrificans]|jgi:large subunit ribosomal protein L18|uniref:Large ribosomal subunit protein uL18 n=1 Tax=Candidatus Competibacter denitrificans Run_A_D11 TaxID=1400863 RepID=W6M334_9GAMM|nr:50S ribosomal protein L18 [Candidatus Competibacter denitrificans]CDI01967.1 50S ribosomal subunit protein L18 [Candidatus Competibacter denitrificans Run_A_D11]HAS87537.1 50S ribosomal protein L18 [Candidatus Competibacteraceae bacterium]HRC68185.1 50S ribosomal protein L18 [Candidatus Competibacter denitrificans]
MDKKAADKKTVRLRRGLRARHKIRELGVHRLCVYRTPSHIYAQIILPAPSGDQTLAAASTLEPALRQTLKSTGNIAAAKLVGKAIAEKAKAIGIAKVAFDRSGFMYHGRVKALADAARENGLEF